MNSGARKPFTDHASRTAVRPMDTKNNAFVAHPNLKDQMKMISGDLHELHRKQVKGSHATRMALAEPYSEGELTDPSVPATCGYGHGMLARRERKAIGATGAFEDAYYHAKGASVASEVVRPDGTTKQEFDPKAKIEDSVYSGMFEEAYLKDGSSNCLAKNVVTTTANPAADEKLESNFGPERQAFLRAGADQQLVGSSLATKNHQFLRNRNARGREGAPLPEYPLPTSKSQVYQELWYQRTGSSEIPRHFRAHIMPTQQARGRPDPGMFSAELDDLCHGFNRGEHYFGAKHALDLDASQRTMAELNSQFMAGVAIAPSDENGAECREAFLKQNLTGVLKESAKATRAEADKESALLEERARQLLEADRSRVMVAPPLIHPTPAMINEPKNVDNQEIFKKRKELEALRFANDERAARFGDWGPAPLGPYGLPGMPSPYGPNPVLAGEINRQEAALFNEAQELRRAGSPTQAAILERRAAELGLYIPAAGEGAQFPYVTHQVEQEQQEVISARMAGVLPPVAAPSAQGMKELAALRYGLDIYGMESSRVFQDGWKLREQELETAHALEAAQARSEFQERQVEMKRLEAEAAARQRQEMEVYRQLQAERDQVAAEAMLASARQQLLSRDSAHLMSTHAEIGAGLGHSSETTLNRPIH